MSTGTVNSAAGNTAEFGHSERVGNPKRTASQSLKRPGQAIANGTRHRRERQAYLLQSVRNISSWIILQLTVTSTDVEHWPMARKDVHNERVSGVYAGGPLRGQTWPPRCLPDTSPNKLVPRLAVFQSTR